jgi:hypothetical protein
MSQIRQSARNRFCAMVGQADDVVVLGAMPVADNPGGLEVVDI